MMRRPASSGKRAGLPIALGTERARAHDRTRGAQIALVLDPAELAAITAEADRLVAFGATQVDEAPAASTIRAGC